MKQPQPFFRSYKLSTWNIITMALYTIISVAMLYYYTYTEYPKTNYLMYFGLATPMCLYHFFLKSLRNFTGYLYWLFIAVIQFGFYLQLKGNPYYENIQGASSAHLLRNTLLMLLLIQALRFLSLKIQKQEFDVPGRGYKDKTWFDNRKVTFIDYMALIIYVSTYMALLFI